ncbi:MAG: hypothetical protein GY854_22440 [Deltaproteobacteria bacterium]|nr:hypothetical protein [Deltaproteobacteria bacterium]
MKALLRTMLMILSLAVAATFVTGCVVHAHSGGSSGRPVREKHGKPAGSSDSDSGNNPPPPPPPSY